MNKNPVHDPPSVEQIVSFLKELCAVFDLTLLVFDAQGELLEFEGRVRELYDLQGNFGHKITSKELLVNLPEFQDELLKLPLGAIRPYTLELRQKHGSSLMLKVALFKHYAIQSSELVLALGQTVLQDNWEEQLIRVDRLAEVGRMAASIVHELKNPIAIMDQAAGWAKTVAGDVKGIDELDQEELISSLTEIERQIDRCRNITNQVLFHVRETEAQSNRFALKDLVSEVISFLDSELRSPNIEVIQSFESDSVDLDSDYKLLSQVFINLLNNAIDAIRERGIKDGKIEIKVLQDSPEKFRVLVIDNGPGMPPEVQQKIFKMFFTTKPTGKGTGIGLPICKKILNRLGGELSCQSTPGKGTTFIIDLPVVCTNCQV